MKNIASFTLKQAVFINVLFVILTTIGVYSLMTTPVENLPPVDMGRVYINTVYYGASADDVEKLVTKEIEDSLDDLENVEFIQSRSMRNTSSIQVKFNDDTDYKRLYDELRFRVQNVKNQLPEGVDDPFFTYLDTKVWIPVIVVNITGDLPNQSLKLLADELKTILGKVDGVQEITISGEHHKEYQVIISPDKLRNHGVSYSEVVQAISSFNVKIPTGRFKINDKNILLDTGNNIRNQNEIMDVIVRKDGDGNFIRVRDLVIFAGIGHRDPDIINSVNGNNTIKLLIKKEVKGNSVSIATAVKELAETFDKAHQKDHAKLVLTYDSTIEINDSVKTLGGNMILGMILVTIILWITLGFRNAMLTAVGIPFSFLMTMIIIKLTGNSINTITLFSFVLVSGIIVDDAVIIIENIYRHLQMDKPRRRAVIDGTAEVTLPVISSALTTVLAFTPMLIMSGSTGEFFSVIPKAVSFALVASLFESLIILPIHVLDWGPKSQNSTPSETISHNSSDEFVHLQKGLFAPFWKYYKKIVTFLLNHKRITIAGITGLFIISVTMMVLSVTGLAPLIKIKFFQDSYLRYHITLKMPPDTSVEKTDMVVKDISKFIVDLGKEQMDSATGTAGLLEDKDYAIHRSQHYGQVVVAFPAQENMELPGFKNDEISKYIDYMRDNIAEYVKRNESKWGALPEINVFGENTGPPTGKAVNIKISADTVEDAISISNVTMNYLINDEQFVDLVNLEDDRAVPMTVAKIKVNQEKAYEYGINSAEATKIIAGVLGGTPVGNYRGVDDEIDLILKVAKNTISAGAITKPTDISSIPIIEHSASPITIGDIADFTFIKEPDIRTRYNGKPTITVSADIKTGSKLSAGRVKVLADRKLKEISAQHPGITINFGGEYESTSRAYTSLMMAFLISLMAIYLVLASQFNDYLQPIIIISAIGFAFIGVVLGMFFTQSIFTIGSFMAIIGLAGVAVNDSLILIDFMNKQKSKGIPLRDAIINGCSARMRPVLITTATTMLGMLPMAIGIPHKSITWGPMAMAFATGLASATILSLLIVPVEYEMTENLKEYLRKRKLKKARKIVLHQNGKKG